ncbi:odorant receptor 13a-like [Pogonomyrmex barbatus]|uniref:Odorant receptor n=1 Tax=Pogonomyrmex barbatus TaxID=144034 RepID=A0A8N1S4F7_9HYME|nr:odorant receptor 13a-like [Pogonomyrmex barbatus]
MTDQKDIWKTRYYLIPRTYMILSGLWPYHRFCDRCIHFISIFTFCFSILISQLLYLIIDSMNINDVIDSATSMIISIIFSFKMIVLLFNNKRVMSCLKVIEEDWFTNIETNAEKIILQRHTEYGQYLNYFFLVFMHLVQVFYLLKPVVLTLLEADIMNSTKSLSKLPFFVEYSVDVERYLYPIMIHCYLAVFAHVFSTIAVDILYYTLIQHACGMFSIIVYVLEEIGKNINANFHLKLNKTTDNDYKKALNCLREHLQVIKCNEIESTFTNVFLISINLNVICGNMCGIQIILKLGNAEDITASLAIYVAQLIHIFLQFWQAQFLLDYSIAPWEAICRGNWYYTSNRCRKLFLLIMSRTMSPCRITAGKIINLSIESFAAVLKTIMSCFIMLRSVQ